MVEMFKMLADAFDLFLFDFDEVGCFLLYLQNFFFFCCEAGPEMIHEGTSKPFKLLLFNF